MLKELNSIANGLLGLQGYPVLPIVAPGTVGKRERAALPKNENVASARATDKPSASRTPAKPARARMHFAW
jgi:hypothetical protein